MNATSMDTGMFEEQPSTFGLSDHDIMSSFTTFTARLGDSLLPKLEPPNRVPTFGAISEGLTTHTRLVTQIQSGVPSLSPPTIGSPTTSNESQSPSPWMPWMSPEQSLLASHKAVFESLPSSQPLPQSQNGMAPMVLHQMYPGLQQSFPVSTEQQVVGSHLLYQQGLFAPSGGATNAGSKQGQLQSGTWNQYMQYLLYQQQLGFQPSDSSLALQQQQYSQQPQVSQQPYQQSLPDPHWQATMMTMMMDSNSTIDPSGRADQATWVSSNGLTFPVTSFQSQHQPGL